YKVNDGLIDSGNATVELIITAINDGPNITINDSSISANEGSAAANSGSWSDVDSTVTIIARDQSNATIGSISVAGQNWFWNYNGTDDLQTVVTVTVTDSFGASDSTSFSLDVNNVAPTAVFTAPLNHVVQAVDTDITFSAQITDPGAFDTHVGAFKFEAPGMDPIVVGAQISGNTASATLAFLEPGVYTTSLTISDDDGGLTTTQLEQFVVNYDPSAGFVTGGGWIDSPAGSLISAPTVPGKANFGFVSKYKKGVTVPVGNTEFQFKAGGLNFKSASYEWLLVSGARAQFRGIGTINGEGEYAFILTAVDGQLPGGDNTDKFRMKIWNRGGSHDVVYDNAAESAISGGSIVIHR
ncbi:MAG: hypothetical protein ACXW3Z_12990, partial [Limisphaerales bacterium]